MNPTRPLPEPQRRSGLGSPVPSKWFPVIWALVLLLFAAGLGTALLA